MEGKSEPNIVVRMMRLWGIAAWMDLLWVTKDLKQFVFYFGAEALLSVAAMSTTLLLAARFNGIGAWSTDQVVFMLAYSTAVMGAMETFFNFNVLEISRRIGRGQLDHVLVQPRPLWVAILTEGFCPFSGSGSLLIGLGLLAWSTSRIGIAVTTGWIALLLVSLAASCAVVLAFSYLWGSLAFWSPRGAEEVCSSSNVMLSALRPFPLDGLGPVLLGGMLTFAPIGFVGWLPARGLLGMGPSWQSAATPIAALLFGIVASFIFRKGLREYGRTGSQRYLSHGHRR
jgi:ABC-2 type transport system permease protein